MIRAILFGFAGSVLGLMSTVVGMLGLSKLDPDPSSSGGYFVLAVLGSPFGIIFGAIAGVCLHYQLTKIGR